MLLVIIVAMSNSAPHANASPAGQGGREFISEPFPRAGQRPGSPCNATSGNSNGVDVYKKIEDGHLVEEVRLRLAIGG